MYSLLVMTNWVSKYGLKHSQSVYKSPQHMTIVLKVIPATKMVHLLFFFLSFFAQFIPLIAQIANTCTLYDDIHKCV